MSHARLALPREVPSERRILPMAAVVALALEFLLLSLVGWNSHWLAHPPPVGEDTSRFIEAQIFETPPQAHLSELTKAVPRAKPEATLSKVAKQGREARPDEVKVQEQNQTDSGPALAPTHGPVATFSPAPHIPAYLQEKELHTSVILDFFVSAQGHSEPRLVGSSGNEELDAIAIETAKTWRFRPGEKDHKPVDAKVRLRIVFEVQ